MTAPLRTLLVGALGLAVLTVAGCQDDDPGSAPTPTTSPSASPTPTGGGSPTPTSPTTGTTGAVSPATGPEVHLKVLSVHAPEGFTLDDTQLTSQEISASSSNGLLQLIELEHAADVPLDVAAANFVKSIPRGKDVKRLPNVLLGQYQVEAARFSWTDAGTGDHFESVLAYRNGTSVSVDLSVTAGRHEKEPDLFDSVLASAQWLV